MKVAGIIAEYNPFHRGHAYHIEEVRRKTGADYVIVIMSGNFVQRGAPAIVDKYTRARMALVGGADLVIEMPVVAATASAETFARAGVAILKATGVVTHLGFGCETDNLELLELLATLFVEEPSEYKELLGTFLRDGKTFPEARAAAASKYLQQNKSLQNLQQNNSFQNLQRNNSHQNLQRNNSHQNLQQNNSLHSLQHESTTEYSQDDICQVLNNPNNILAIEYLKAIRFFDADLIPCPILRQGNHYHEEELSEQKMASATAIRQTVNRLFLEKNSKNSLEKTLLAHIPKDCANILAEHLQRIPPVDTSDFSDLLLYKLHVERHTFADYLDVKQELANRILNMRERFSEYESFVEMLKTRNSTYTSICRGLLHILLDIKESDLQALAAETYAPYIRVLGFRKSASELLKKMNTHSENVITKLAQDKYALTENAKLLLELDINSTHIYNSAVAGKATDEFPKNEYRTPLIYLEL